MKTKEGQVRRRLRDYAKWKRPLKKVLQRKGVARKKGPRDLQDRARGLNCG